MSIYFLNTHKIEDKAISLSIDKHDNSEFTAYDSKINAVNGMSHDLDDFIIDDVYHFIAAGNKIANWSRRGIAKTIYTNKKWIASFIDMFNLKSDYGFIIEYDENYKETIIAYNGSIEYDKCISYQDETFWIHPNYKNLARRIVFS